MYLLKYAPKSFDDFVGNKDVVNIVKNFNETLPNIIAVGPIGSGKKTLLKLLAKKILGDVWRENFFYYDLSSYSAPFLFKSRNSWTYSQSKKDLVSIKDIAQSMPIGSPVKFILLDNIQVLDFESQQALRVLMERGARFSKFFLVGTALSNIIPAIRSRTIILRFSKLNFDEFLRIVEPILKKEKKKYDKKALAFLFSKTSSNLIEALSILDVCEDVNVDNIKKFLPASLYTSLFNLFLKNDFKGWRKELQNLLFKKNESPDSIVKNFISLVEQSNIPQSKKLKYISKLSLLEPNLYDSNEVFFQLENIFSQLMD